MAIETYEQRDARLGLALVLLQEAVRRAARQTGTAPGEKIKLDIISLFERMDAEDAKDMLLMALINVARAELPS